MTKYLTSAELKDLAKEKLTRKYSIAVLVTLMYGALLLFANESITMVDYQLTGTLERITGLTADSSLFIQLTTHVITLLFTALFQIISIGITLFYLNLACNHKLPALDLFFGFRQGFDKSFLLCGAVTLIGAVCTLPAQLGLFWSKQDLSLQTLLLLLAAQLVGTLVYIPLSLGLSQCYYLLLDYPELKAKEIIRLSYQTMKGHKARLFYIELSFLPLVLLSLLSFGIGLLWLIPYRNTTYALFFLDIMNPKKEQ